MMNLSNQLRPETFERLREQLGRATRSCSDEQLLELADSIHDMLRRRREERIRRGRASASAEPFAEPKSFAGPGWSGANR